MTAFDHDIPLLDRYLDGECSPGERQEIEGRLAADPALRARARALGELRRRVTVVLEEPRHTPPLLAEAVRSRVGEAAAARRWWDGPQRANALAVAASLALVAGAVLFGIYGPRMAGRAGMPQDTPATEVASWLSTEHERCSESESYRDAKARWRNPEQAAGELTALLGQPACVPDLTDAGYRFVGAGPCHVPGADQASAHLLYRKGNDGDAAYLSVFVVTGAAHYMVVDPYGRTAPLVPGVDHDLIEPGGSEMRYWSDGALNWFVSGDVPADLDAVRPLLACR